MAPKRELFVETGGGDGGAPPQEKRPRAEAAPGGSSISSSAESPSSPKHFLTIVLVVLFLKRPKGRSTDTIPISASRFGRLDQLCRFIHTRFRKLEETMNSKMETMNSKLEIMDSKLETMDSKLETMDSKLERIKEQTGVDNITRPSPNDNNHEKFTQEANQKGTTAEAERLATTEGKGENASIQLRFLNGMKMPVYHDDEIKSDSNTAIKIGIFGGEKLIESGRLSNLQIEVFALEGDFPHASPKSWTSKKFNKHRAIARDGRGNVLAGEGIKAQLKNGQCDLGRIKFTKNSSKARSGKFIIGARVCEGQVSGVCVQEAIMNPVVVQDRRNKLNEKSHPPKLKDEVHRLEEIAKDGKYCKRLGEQNIFTVEEFLKALNKDPDNLAKILQVKKEHGNWKKMVEHARKCCLKRELKSYRCSETNVVLFFNCVHGLVGAEFGGHYTASNNFDEDQQDLVDKLKGSAYDQLDTRCPDHVMKETDNFPRPLYADIGAGSCAGPSYMPNDCSGRLASHQVGGIPVAEGLSHTQIGPSTANRNNDPCPSSSIPNHYNAHEHHGNQLAGQEQVSSAPLNDWRQDPLEQLNYCNWTDGVLYCRPEEEDIMHLLNEPVAPRLDESEIQRQSFCQGNGTLDASISAQGYMTSTTHQPMIGGHPGSAQGSIQSQTQAPWAPSNGTSEASTSAQQVLPPQQWSQFPRSGSH